MTFNHVPLLYPFPANYEGNRDPELLRIVSHNRGRKTDRWLCGQPPTGYSVRPHHIDARHELKIFEAAMRDRDFGLIAFLLHTCFSFHSQDSKVILECFVSSSSSPIYYAVDMLEILSWFDVYSFPAGIFLSCLRDSLVESSVASIRPEHSNLLDRLSDRALDYKKEKDTLVKEYDTHNYSEKLNLHLAENRLSCKRFIAMLPILTAQSARFPREVCDIITSYLWIENFPRHTADVNNLNEWLFKEDKAATIAILRAFRNRAAYFSSERKDTQRVLDACKKSETREVLAGSLKASLERRDTSYYGPGFGPCLKQLYQHVSLFEWVEEEESKQSEEPALLPDLSDDNWDMVTEFKKT